jgi:hypothetical protein
MFDIFEQSGIAVYAGVLVLFTVLYATVFSLKKVSGCSLGRNVSLDDPPQRQTSIDLSGLP